MITTCWPYEKYIYHDYLIAIYTVNSSTTTNLPYFDFSLLTVFSENHMGMDLPTGFVPVNSSEVRGRTLSTEKNHSRDSSMSFTVSFVIYHER